MAADARPPDPPPSTPRYTAAGVDIDAGARLVPRLRALAAEASRPEVVGGVGAFAGLFDLSAYRAPLLAASTDGVGSKVLVARALGRYESVGEDLVNHCINDVLTAGAKPLFFLDYLAGNGLSEEQKVALVRGVARACRRAGVALLGGETADLPGLYRDGDFDLAGTMVGVIEGGRPIDGAEIAGGDLILGLPSNGLHTNGYSLARAVFGLDGEDRTAALARLTALEPELGEPLGEALLRPHLSYWPLLEPVLPWCKGIAHITGGGIAGNLVRVLPPGTTAVVHRGRWPVPPIFGLIQRTGGISAAEMWDVFNLGMGLMLVVREGDLARVEEALPGALRVGEVVARAGEARVEVVPAGP